jgi:hypothetical protein
MDEIVRKALAKWPDVPDVFGWLRLDRRGRWLLKVARPQAAPGDVEPRAFEPIGNAAFNEFISRNYQPDERGRWYFQNGPQRVFATLDATPWIYRLDDQARGWLAHTGEKAGALSELLFDEQGGVVLVAALGPGLVIDRDTAALLDALQDAQGKPLAAETLIAALKDGQGMRVKLLGAPVTAAMLHGSLAARFGFDPDPTE